MHLHYKLLPNVTGTRQDFDGAMEQHLWQKVKGVGVCLREELIDLYALPSLTWNLKMVHWNRIFPFGTIIFSFHSLNSGSVYIGTKRST